MKAVLYTYGDPQFFCRNQLPRDEPRDIKDKTTTCRHSMSEATCNYLEASFGV
jgi:hypothetical protein